MGNGDFMTELYDGAQPTDNPSIWENENGFWFSDETEQLQGPYATMQGAVIALDGYVNWLNNGPTAGNTTANLPQCDVKYYGG
jgi:hypothetical protein